MHLLLTSDTVGGVWRYSLQLAASLAAHNVSVSLVSVGEPPSAAQTAELRALPNLRGTYHIGGKLEWMQESAVEVVAAQAEMGKLVEAVQPDLLHSNQFCFGTIQTTCPRVVVGHSDVLSWQRWCGDDEPDASWLTFLNDYRALVSAGLQGAHAVVAPSHFMAACLRDYALAQEPQVIYNGLAIEPVSRPKRANTVVLAGRLWDKAKNVALVLDALSTPEPAQTYSPGLRLLLAGAEAVTLTPHPSPLQGEGNSVQVEYLGNLPPEQLYAVLAEAEVYLAASRYEPFGLAAVEAARHGCAVLANSIPTFREVWGEAACYFAYNDASSLRAQLSWLLADRQRLAAYSSTAG